VLTPRIAALSILLAAPVAVAATAPEWATAVGLDVWSIPALQAEIDDQVERERALVAQDDDIRRRIEVKETLITDLIAGRATLTDVTAQFLSLNRAQPHYLQTLRAAYPSPTDEETVARTVLGFVATRMYAEPADRRGEVMARLDAELSRLVEAQTPVE
jgi:hypothetical protein